MQAPEWPWDRTEASLALRSCVQAELEQLVVTSYVSDGGLLTQAQDNSLWHSRGKVGGGVCGWVRTSKELLWGPESEAQPS